MATSIIMKLSLTAASAAFFTLVSSPSYAANLVSNGSFESGLTGWTLNNPSESPNGVSLIDIDGSGSLDTSNAFFVKAGGGYGTQSFDLSQNVSLLAGETYSFFANIASTEAVFSNASGGVVTASINGTTIASFNFDYITAGTTETATLSGTFTASTTGSYLLNLNFFRPYIFNSNTPSNYIDNVALEGKAATSVPEPASVLGLLALGAMGAGSLKRKQQQNSTEKA